MVGKRRTKKPRSSVTERWERDGEPSSMDILVEWLETPGNYERWKRDSRAAACQDVVALLQENGIGQRSATAVWSKIYRIGRQWENANAWLKNSGLLDAYQEGEVDNEIRASVNKLCPRFDRVSPVFRNARMGTEEAAATDEDEAADDSNSEHGSQLVTQKAVMATKESAKKFDIDDEDHQHRQELFQCEYEAKRVQADVEIVCARVLGRQRLLNAGVEPKVVDDVLPPL